MLPSYLNILLKVVLTTLVLTDCNVALSHISYGLNVSDRLLESDYAVYVVSVIAVCYLDYFFLPMKLSNTT